MPLSMQQVQKLQQRLIMTPQMQQSVKLLQMNTLELEALTEQELLENPFLEIEEDISDSEPIRDLDTRESSDDAQVLHERDLDPESDWAENDGSYETAPETRESRENDIANPGEDSPSENALSEKESEPAAGDSDAADDVTADLVATALEDQPEQFSEVDTDWAELFEDDGIRNYAPPKQDVEERSFEETLAERSSLYEMLEWQLRVSSLEDEDKEIGAYLIGCIDDNGYLQTTVEECAEKFGCASERVERVLSVIQDFEPTGIGARDLPECLCLQLAAQNRLTPLAESVLRNHWPLLARKKFKEIARLVNASEQDIRDLFDLVRKLQPSPGRAYSKEQPLYIIPDVYVKREDKRYVTYLNEGRVAHLHLSNAYKEILLDNSADQDPKAREYAAEKYRAAVMFLKNVEKRRNTVLRVTEAIMDYQRDFLEKGVEALKPLSLGEIATRVGMHESTISRVTSNKYVDTPRGLFLLKYFFSSAIESRNGEAASSRAIKQKIREIITAENPDRPLSDDKIARMLKSQGFSIARRTVAKYREQLKILPTNLRRQVS